MVIFISFFVLFCFVVVVVIVVTNLAPVVQTLHSAIHWINRFPVNKYQQGAKKIIFTACHSGKLKLAFTSPDVISTSPKIFLTSRIDFTALLLFKLLKKYHLPVGQVKNRIHQPNSKIHYPPGYRTLLSLHADYCPFLSKYSRLLQHKGCYRILHVLLQAAVTLSD